MVTHQPTRLPSDERRPILRGVVRPSWVSSAVRQTCILVRDNSGSMSGCKAAEASAASEELAAALAEPVNKDAFDVAIVDFSEDAQVAHPLMKATELSGKVRPLCGDGGWTNITAALESALQVLCGPTATAGLRVKPAVILFTDGQHNTGEDPRPVAQALRQKADVVAVTFGDDADEALLTELATSPQHVYRCQSGRELRAFLAAVGATLSLTLGARQDATAALAHLHPAQPGQGSG